MFSVVDSVFGKVQEACDSAGVPYVLDTNFPSDKATWEAIQADELYVGGVAASPYNMGKECAEQVKDPKGKTALILGAAIGDYSHDQRILGFTETFEAAGGKVAGSVSAKTSYLINNDLTSGSGKNKKAKELGIPIIDEETVKGWLEAGGVTEK